MIKLCESIITLFYGKDKKSGEKGINDHLITCVCQSHYPSAKKKKPMQIRDAQCFGKSKG